MSYFFTNPKREHHLRELASILKRDVGNLSREMKYLTSTGLFTFREKGRLKLFSLNDQYPLFQEIRALILKNYGAKALLRQALEKSKDIEKAFLYGSFADASMDVGSDIDLMVIGEIRSVELAGLIQPLERQLGREIHFRIMGQKEFDTRLRKQDPFLVSVLKGKIIPLVGEP